jgi:hypothetical protein
MAARAREARQQLAKSRVPTMLRRQEPQRQRRSLSAGASDVDPPRDEIDGAGL